MDQDEQRKAGVNEETPDVEGHKKFEATDEGGDDVEAHRRHPMANDEGTDDSSDDVEGHMRRANEARPT